MTDIVVKNINKRFGQKIALKDFNVTFEAGSRTCIMGPSGCGKTTLIRIMTGVEIADSGSIEGMPSHVTMVFQEDRLCETLSVRTNLMMIAKKDCDKVLFEKECDVLLDKLEILSEKNSKVESLSGGMKRRVAIARALLYGGDLVIMDEPFKGLDDDMREITAKLISDRFNGKTMIIISHDEKEAELMNARIIHMEKAV